MTACTGLRGTILRLEFVVWWAILFNRLSHELHTLIYADKQLGLYIEGLRSVNLQKNR